MTDIEKVDLVVVGNRPCTEHVCSDLRSYVQRLTPSTLSGSGWHGLAAAKTYLEVHPHAEFVIYESASTVGGTWANERLYPGLKSNNMLGTYEYSDYPMDTETYGVKPGEHIPGHVIHKYLSNFAESHGIHQRIRFDTNVQSARHVEGGGWLITVSRSIDDGGPEFCEIFASKLIAATGLTSTPSVPNFPGSKSFEVPLFHCKDFPKYASTTDTTRNVCVFGGTKSAWDVVYAYGSKGVRVDWIIRASGHGPTWSKSFWLRDVLVYRNPTGRL
jgi:cation diffusion facilitator CzcD-associated flavoprotein CzcO